MKVADSAGVEGVSAQFVAFQSVVVVTALNSSGVGDSGSDSSMLSSLLSNRASAASHQGGIIFLVFVSVGVDCGIVVVGGGVGDIVGGVGVGGRCALEPAAGAVAS